VDQLLSDPACAVEGVLAAGHVCTVLGDAELKTLVQQHRRPVVITGFTAEELLQGILSCVRQLEGGRYQLENAYATAVRSSGNPGAQVLLEQVFEPVDTSWRGLGLIRAGGYQLRPPFDRLAVQTRQGTGANSNAATQDTCPSGLVLRGLLRPSECPSFGTRCTPDAPMGAPMVSSEGACAAYYRYQS
jgi:hydrogenase expression/formation protein HypD